MLRAQTTELEDIWQDVKPYDEYVNTVHDLYMRKSYLRQQQQKKAGHEQSSVSSRQGAAIAGALEEDLEYESLMKKCPLNILQSMEC